VHQTLFHIPHQLFGTPLLGWGWLLAVWVLGGVVLLVWLVRRQGWNADTLSYLPILALVAAAIWFVLPHVEEQPAAGPPLGLPIRGYGVMFLVGVLCGLVVAVRTARRMGVDPDIIYSLTFHIVAGGIIGARTFYVIQYWPQFRKDTAQDTLLAIANVTQGGLVVYGGLLGGLLAGAYFLRRFPLPFRLAYIDIMTPSMMVGLALGRVGCLLNGCCYGGHCDTPWLAVRFPPGSPPYVHQRGLGELHGFRIGPASRDGTAVVRWVEPGGPAAAAGLAAGTRIHAINGMEVRSAQAAQAVLEVAAPDLQLETDRGRVVIALGLEPPRSLPVHPTQLYAAMTAALLFFLLWAYYPFRRRDGELFAVLLTLYPIARILEEAIRTDEPGRFGTPLTISQWVSVLLLAVMAALWVFLRRRPRGSVLPLPAGAADNVTVPR
jgi:phosphatidylglycerol:prolipoprotein diacylglycerol transferase